MSPTPSTPCAAPVVSDSISPNRPASTALSVTVSGLNFEFMDSASVDTTPTVQVALGACDTAAWASGTSIRCFQTNQGTPHDRTTHVTVAGLVGTAIPGFTFDGPHPPTPQNVSAAECNSEPNA